MLRIRTSALLAGLVVMLGGAAAFGAEGPKEHPEFREAYDLIREHLYGAPDADMNRAALEGLVAALSPKVSLVPASPATNQPALALVSKSGVFDDAVAYVRVGEVTEGVAEAIRAACDQLAASNHLKGIVLDLRFARGGDYAAAVATADLFLKQERPLLNWGQGVARSSAKTESIALPAAVLVNHQTAGAAEALAAMLREAGAGLILGSRTAGQALMFQEFGLTNGDRLRIATAPIQLGDGSPLSSGVKPDIAVEVSSADERTYFADAYKVINAVGLAAPGTPGLTNLPRRIRFNEAELVRERREGSSPEEAAAAMHKLEPEAPLVQDPVLARALDLLKGLAVVRQARS